MAPHDFIATDVPSTKWGIALTKWSSATGIMGTFYANQNGLLPNVWEDSKYQEIAAVLCEKILKGKHFLAYNKLS